MKLKTGDKVVIIAGKNKGSQGKIIKVLKNEQKVVVEGLNIIKKHLKPNANNQSGSIIQKEAPIHISNVMLIDPKTNKRTRTKVATEIKEKEVKKETKTSKPRKTKSKEKQD